MMTRDEAFALLTKYNKEDFHLHHAQTVEGTMRYFAEKLGYGDEADFWALVGLLHDIDFEMWPEQHCRKASELLAEAGNSINGLAGFSMDRLCAVPGIGKAKAATLMAVFEIAKRIESEKLGPRPLVTDSKAAYRIIAPELRNLCHEECWVLYLNRAGKLISKERSSTGGIACTVMDTKKILKSAVEKSASSIIIAHNHPSGNPFPGEQDRKQTKILKEAAAILDITLVDHIIVGKNGYFSFCDEGL